MSAMSERDLFTAARAKTDPVARLAFLAQACAGNAALRARIERLLREDGLPHGLLDVPAVAPPDWEPTHGQTVPPEPATDATVGGNPLDEPLPFLAAPGRSDSLGRIGHYEVLEVLGKGGFGIVFRAFDELLQRVVAIKVLAPQLAATSSARQRFLREARSTAAVRHEHVVQVHAVEEQPLPLLVMEFIPGETLRQRLDRSGPLEVAEVLRIGRQIAEGLAAAHATRLIHRDIKPANVLLERRPQERVKLTDFGLARAADDASVSQSGLIVGTPMYMSPEQARGEPVDHRSDLFSLGSVLYEMTSGRPPFRAAHVLAVLKRVNEDTPRPIRDIIPETPVWLCDLIARLQAKDPAQRIQSAREVAELLARGLTRLQQPDAALDVPRWGRGWAIAAAVGLLLAGLGVTHLGGPILGQFAPEATPVVDRPSPPSAKVPDLSPRAAKPAPQGRGLQFNDKGEIVEVPDFPLPVNGPYTLEAYVVRTGGPKAHRQVVIGHGPNCRATALEISAYRRPFPTWRFSWAFPRAIGEVHARSDERFHLAAVHTGTEASLFVNGKTDVAAVPARTGQPEGPVVLTFGLYFVGTIEQVRISRTARYSGEFTPQARLSADNDTLGLYTFDEGQGETLHDRSGNNRHGKILGATWVAP